MRVLVTGGAGFVGSHLARGFAAAGHCVRALDDLSTGEACGVPPGVALVRGDVRDGDLVASEVARADLVLHFAAAVGVQVVARDPAGTWSRNVTGTAAVLEAASGAGARVILASSSEVYGPEQDGPLRESDPVRLHTDGRRDVYALSKAAGEAYALALGRTADLPVTILRLFNVVGAGQSDRYGMVLPRFARAARRERPLTVYGDGLQRRCFLHVEDAVRAVSLVADAPETVGHVLNLGSDEEVGILDLARLTIAEAGGRGAIRHVPFERVYGADFADPRRRVPSIEKLQRLTGFVPRRSVRDAVRELLTAEPVG